MVDVPGGQIRQRSSPLVSVFDSGGLAGAGRVGGVETDPGLDGGLLVGGDDVVVVSQRLSLPGAVIQVEDPAGFGLEVGGAGKDPRPVGPRFDGVLG